MTREDSDAPAMHARLMKGSNQWHNDPSRAPLRSALPRSGLPTAATLLTALGNLANSATPEETLANVLTNDAGCCGSKSLRAWCCRRDDGFTTGAYGRLEHFETFAGKSLHESEARQPFETIGAHGRAGNL